MRGMTEQQLAMLTTLSPESLIPVDHPIRRIRKVVDAVLAELDGEFWAMYSALGRPSVPPEQLLKATVLMAMYSIRSERAFCERLNYDLLFKWFLDLPIDAPSFDATTFSKNRTRLLDHEIADRFFAAVVRQAKLRRYLSSEHFSVDGTLLEAWASHKSFKPKDGSGPDPTSGGRNAEVDFHGQRRSNDTHASTTDPEARLARKSNATAAKMSFAGHLLMENRNALLVDVELTEATGYAERDTALEMLERLRHATGVARSRPTRVTTLPDGSPMSVSSASRHTSRRTRRTGAARSTGGPPDIPDIRSANGSANGSRNRSDGSKPSAVAASCATSANDETEHGSS